MLARCPQCGVTHALARGAKIRQRRVHCTNCGAEFDLFPALEIGGAGERVLGEGLLPVSPLGIERTPRIPLPLNIEYPPGPMAPTGTTRQRLWPQWLLASALVLLLGLQLLAVPPVAPGHNPHLDQARAQFCEALPCPAWHPPRAPDRIRLSPPEFFTDAAGRLHLHVVLETPVRQAWPVLDIQLSDQIGTRHGTLRVAPTDYSDPDPPMNAHEPVTLRLTLAPPRARITGIQIQAR